MTPEEKQARIAQIEARLAELKAPVKEEPGMMDYAMRGLNYAGGLGRAAVAGAMEPIVGKDLVSMEQALKGEVPGSAEIMEKAGVPNVALSEMLPQMYSETGEGLAFEKGGMFDPTARGAAGLVADIALDPTTYLAAPLKAAQLAKAGTAAGKALKFGEILMNPLGEAVGAMGKGLKTGGEAFYKSAFEKADRELATRYGKGSMADLLKSKGFKGSAEKAYDITKEINKEAADKIAAYRDKASIDGILEKPMGFEEADKFIQSFRSSPDPKKMAIADSLQETLDAYRNMPAKTAKELADNKKLLRSDFQGDTFTDQTRIAQTPEKATLAKMIYSPVAKAEDDAVKKALSPKEFEDYLKAKKEYGMTTKFAQKEMLKLANKEMIRTGVAPSAVDYFATGAALASGDPSAMLGVLAKKGRDIGRLTGTKTRVGPMMEAAGKGIQATAAKIPPQLWLEMLRSKPEGEQQ
jgi:hypothetical protein